MIGSTNIDPSMPATADHISVSVTSTSCHAPPALLLAGAGRRRGNSWRGAPGGCGSCQPIRDAPIQLGVVLRAAFVRPQPPALADVHRDLHHRGDRAVGTIPAGLVAPPARGSAVDHPLVELPGLLNRLVVLPTDGDQ